MDKEYELKRCADALERIAELLESVLKSYDIETKSGGTGDPPPPPPPHR